QQVDAGPVSRVIGIEAGPQEDEDAAIGRAVPEGHGLLAAVEDVGARPASLEPEADERALFQRVGEAGAERALVGRARDVVEVADDLLGVLGAPEHPDVPGSRERLLEPRRVVADSVADLARPRGEKLL